jgi:hypothetical protein
MAGAKNPVAGGDRARKMSCVVADTFEHTSNDPSFQPLGAAAAAVVADLTARRIAWLLTRHGVDEPMARALAQFAFETLEARQ